MTTEKLLVAVIMGSQSDWDTMKHADETLAQFGVAHESRVISAHRSPSLAAEFGSTAEERGLEVIIAAILLPTALLVNVSTLERVALVGCVVLILIVELLNSAVEAAIDRVGTDHHPLSGRAKDLGSAAVFVALAFCGFTWISILWF